MVDHAFTNCGIGVDVLVCPYHLGLTAAQQIGNGPQAALHQI